MSRRLLNLSGILITASLVLTACGAAPTAAPTVAPTSAPQPTIVLATSAPQLKDIVDTAVAAGSFKTLATALTEAGLIDTLKGAGPFTVFAPTDAAFAKLPAGTLDALLKDKSKLKAVLTYHVVAGKVMASDVVKLSKAKTVQGEDVAIKIDGSTVMINGAKVTTADIAASNGVIHVIDTVILPPSMTAMEKPMGDLKDIVDTAVAAGSFKTLATALTEAGLIDTLKGAGPFTVFAPTDAAFAKLPAGTLDALLKDKSKLKAVLTYHVVAGKVMASDVVKLSKAKTVQGEDVAIKVDGSTVMINGAKVTTADIAASNGVIHVIDTVILPPSMTAMEKPMGDLKDIVDTAVAAGSFKTLATALTAAGLIDTLKGAGPFTVFAPTDAAFAKLPAGTLDALLKDKSKLKAILTYHVVAGKVMASDVLKLSKAKTVQGEDVAIKVDGSTVMINGAKVTTADIATSNGIIHIIDTVILPPSMK